MIRQSNNDPFSQRQLRVGELIKQSLGEIFLKDEFDQSWVLGYEQLIKIWGTE